MSPVPAVVAYDDAWPASFERERAALTPVLAPWATTPVEHIGSTAIPGMPAKPLLDLMVGVASLQDAGAAAEAVERHGWARRVHRVDARLVVLVHEGMDRCSLQITGSGSELWRERLAFRDALRGDPGLVAAYATLKRDLLTAAGGAPYRAADKREFVRRVLAGAGVTLRDDRHADDASRH